MKKAMKVIGITVLILLILIVLFVLGSFIYQSYAQKKDRMLLEKDGFSHLVSAGDYNMNINIYGDGKYKIIAMPGYRDAWFPVDMKQFSAYLSDDISLVVVSRPGYGLCEETDQEITTEYIVESTRTALNNAGIEAPYILMPHSLSGIYATYWESTYPEDISGVIFLDSVNEAQKEFTDADIAPPSAAEMFLGKAGVYRAVYELFYGASEEDGAALYNINPTDYSGSCISEDRNCNVNMRTAWSSIRQNEIPKIYVSTDYQTVADAEEYLMTLEGTSDAESAKQLFEESQSEEAREYRLKRSDYIQKVGNCTEVNIPGSHFIYNQKPEECAKVIEDFICSISLHQLPLEG